MASLAQRGAAGVAIGCLAGLLAGCASGGDMAGAQPGSGRGADLRRVAIRLQLAAGYYEQGQLAVALDEVQLALRADPDSADALGMQGLIYAGLGETGLAEDSFLRGLRLAPRNPDLNNNYGAFLCHGGRAERAMPFFEAALASAAYRSPGEALNNAGACRLALRQDAEAERHLLLAWQLTPARSATNANLARIYYGRRDFVRAGFFITQLADTATMDSLTADVLWLAVRVQHQLGEAGAEADWAAHLRRRHAGSREYAAYQRGAFDE